MSIIFKSVAYDELHLQMFYRIPQSCRVKSLNYLEPQTEKFETKGQKNLTISSFIFLFSTYFSSRKNKNIWSDESKVKTFILL